MASVNPQQSTFGSRNKSKTSRKSNTDSPASSLESNANDNNEINNTQEKTSRIFVQGFPKHLTNDQLREVFEVFGEVTDARVMCTSTGKNRRFGFVGFRSVDAASSAVERRHNTRIGLSRISVTFARPIGDRNLPRPWSKYSKGSSAYARRQQQAEQQEQAEQGHDGESSGSVLVEKIRERQRQSTTDDPLLAELVGVSKGGDKFWANDDDDDDEQDKNQDQKRDGDPVLGKRQRDDGSEDSNRASKAMRMEGMFEDEDDEDDDEYEDMTIRREVNEDDVEEEEDDISSIEEGTDDNDNVSYNNNHKNDNNDNDNNDSDNNDSDSDSDIDSDSDSAAEEEINHPQARENNRIDNNDDNISNPDSDSDSDSDPHPDTSNVPSHKTAASDSEVNVRETGRLFVHNLPYGVTEEDIMPLFEQYGTIAEVHMPADPVTGRTKGLAYILYAIPDNAATALHAVHNTVFQGRLIFVSPSRPPPSASASTSSHPAAKSSYKKEQEQTQAEKAEDARTWNSLLMRGDAVAASVSSRLGVSKGEFLSREADDVAVRMAVAETEVVNEARQVLEEEGIDLDAITKRSAFARRSRHILLVKNLPAEISAEDLRSRMSRHGTVGRLVLPPSRAIGLVEFMSHSAARKALLRMSNRPLQRGQPPLYLEYAPVKAAKTAMKTAAGDSHAHPNRAAAVPDAEPEQDQEKDGYAVQVAGLGDTTEDDLRTLFSKYGRLSGVVLYRKSDGQGGATSLGYGRVMLPSRAAAQRAQRELDGYRTGSGHVLRTSMPGMEKEEKEKEGEDGAVRDEAGNIITFRKLSVKNIPFEATDRELRKLFATYGKTTDVRIPRKGRGGHRGFGFVEFATPREAYDAFQSLRNTHLYGRHLVIDFARDQDSLDKAMNSNRDKLDL